ncbi:putative uncharacterized protein DDB_G0286901 [Hylaeus volcanicus]|uniref:putative uncharacterized protein DDB_G0286901 n=1 Tax=Hylaeus volcanicus TaxID=313075 RepID=UPI0023B7CE37|nr:putative uncharacterized protein DDB_G0286901 [Hylaeus volcanicus]
MTRFARAKGSKASNERVPNDATPWHVMKQQLTENVAKQQEHSIRNKSAKELLQDKQNLFYCDVGNVNNDWAEFEESSMTKSNNPVKKKTKKKQEASVHSNILQMNKSMLSDTVEICNEDKTHVNVKDKKKSSLKRNISEVDNSTTNIKLKKRKKDKDQSGNISSTQNNHSIDEVNVKTNEADANHSKLNKIKKKKHSDGKSVNTSIESSNASKLDKGKQNASHDTYNTTKEKEDMLPKHQKHNMRKQKNNINTNTSETNGNTTKLKTKFKNNNNNGERQNNQNTETNKHEENIHVTKQFNKKFVNNPNKFHTKQFENNRINKRKAPKIRDDKEHKRRKADLGPTKVVINGVEIEIVKFGGFPVRKEDAERLHELKQKMIMKGIPKKETDAAIKLERRKAEKALARIRKCVCFHCRKAGHNLSDCPELGIEQAGTGICFKCGSTEHTHFECKVAKPTEFRYATCFICREQGHIAKQCPDNPKGVYPQGGSCKVCGDVTHLKKDCPDLIKEKEENTITVNSIANGNLESLEENVKIVEEKTNKKSKKVVKF